MDNENHDYNERLRILKQEAKAILGLISEEQRTAWLMSLIDSHDSQVEFLRKCFCKVVTGLTSNTWEDIWERVRDKFAKEG